MENVETGHATTPPSPIEVGGDEVIGVPVQEVLPFDVISMGLERIGELIEDIDSRTTNPEAVRISQWPSNSHPMVIAAAVKRSGLKELSDLLGNYLPPEMKERVKEILR